MTNSTSENLSSHDPLLHVEFVGEQGSFENFVSTMEIIDEISKAAYLFWAIGPSERLVEIANEQHLARQLEQRLRAPSLERNLRPEIDNVLRLELEMALELAHARARILEKSLLLGVPLQVWDDPWRWRSPENRWPNLWAQRAGRIPRALRVPWQSMIRLADARMKSPLLVLIEVGGSDFVASLSAVAGAVLLAPIAAFAYGYVALRLMHMDREEQRLQREGEARTWLIEQLVARAQSVDREVAAAAIEQLVQLLNSSADRLRDRGIIANLPGGLSFLSKGPSREK